MRDSLGLHLKIERLLREQIKDLKRRIDQKDKLIKKAVKTVVDEHKSS